MFPWTFNYSKETSWLLQLFQQFKNCIKIHWASSSEKITKTDPCGFAEHLMLPWCCFMSLSPKLSLLCFCVLFLQDCLRLPSPPLICIPSCIETLHLWALPIYSLCPWECQPFHQPWHSSLHGSRFLFPLICLVQTSSYFIPAAYSHLSFFSK